MAAVHLQQAKRAEPRRHVRMKRASRQRRDCSDAVVACIEREALSNVVLVGHSFVGQWSNPSRSGEHIVSLPPRGRKPPRLLTVHLGAKQGR